MNDYQRLADRLGEAWTITRDVSLELDHNDRTVLTFALEVLQRVELRLRLVLREQYDEERTGR